MGAIINIENTTTENILAAAAASRAGQMIGRAVGTDAQSIRNEIASIRPLLIQDFRQSSEMGSRGLDSEKELEFYLQAATDPARDIKSNIAATIILDEAFGSGALAEKLSGKTTKELRKELESEWKNQQKIVEDFSPPRLKKVVNPSTGEEETRPPLSSFDRRK